MLKDKVAAYGTLGSFQCRPRAISNSMGLLSQHCPPRDEYTKMCRCMECPSEGLSCSAFGVCQTTRLTYRTCCKFWNRPSPVIRKSGLSSTKPAREAGEYRKRCLFLREPPYGALLAELGGSDIAL